MATITDRLDQLGRAICDSLKDHEARIKALERAKPMKAILAQLQRDHLDMVAPDFRQKFTQADLDVKVKAERERIMKWAGKNWLGHGESECVPRDRLTLFMFGGDDKVKK